MARFGYLTEELIIEMFSWLPADSLMRFKCLNKSSYSLIKNPQFIVKQLHNHVHSSSKNNLCVLLRHWTGSEIDDKKGENFLSLLIYNDMIQATSEGDDFPFLMKTMSLPFYKDYPHWVISGSCDGIILFHNNYNNGEIVIIANPGLGEFRILPRSCICPLNSLPTDFDDPSFDIGIIGLGYDSKANDYKIVRVWSIWNVPSSPPLRAEVYTLSMDSWKEIDNPVMEVEINDIVMSVNIFHQHCFEKYWNGAYYWFALGFRRDCPQKYKKFIALFDMTDEVFQYILMPESCQDHDNASFTYAESLLEFNGSLALFYFPYEEEEKSFEVWAMDEFKVDGIWTKILCFGPLLGIVRPLVFVNSSQLLMEGKGGQIVSYNPKTRKVKGLPIYGEVSSFEAMIYRRSLVSIHGGKMVHN